jgi:hypothetical protein
MQLQLEIGFRTALTEAQANMNDLLQVLERVQKDAPNSFIKADDEHGEMVGVDQASCSAHGS